MSNDAGWEATIDKLKWFLVRALGEPEPEYAGSLDVFDGMYAPAAIREVYQFAANWPCTSNSREWPLFGGYWPQNQLLTPAGWVPDGDLVVFASENQGVCRWAFAATDPNEPSPMVYCDNEGWENSLGEPLADFLLSWCVYEVSVRCWIHGDARVWHQIEHLTPELVVESPTFGTFTLYPNNVLTTIRYNERIVSVVGTEAVSQALGEAAAPYRTVELSFSFENQRWNVALDELGGGSVRFRHRQLFDVGGLVPAAMFDKLFDAAIAEERTDSSFVRITTAEPHAQITSHWGDTVRRKGYLPDELVDQVFQLLRGNHDLAPLIDSHSPFG